MLQKLPKRKETTNTGITAEEFLHSRFAKFSNVIPTPTSKDLGIDMRAELFENNYPTGIHFNIQCKGTREFISGNSEIKIPIKVTTINYWLQQREPTFLIVVNTTEDEFYWCYPFEQIKDKIDEIQNQESITIKLDQENKCNSKIEDIPSGMLEYINDYHYDVLEKIVFTLTKLNSSAINESNPCVEVFSDIEKMNVAIKKIMKSVNVVQELNDSIQMQVKIIVNKEISNYYDAIVQLDYITETKRYLRSDSVYDESFSGRVPRILINRLEEKAEKYFNDASNQNLSELKIEINELIELNKDLHGFLKEMKMEEGWDPF